MKLRYAEEVDYRDYEKQIQKMLNTYVQADEVVQIVDPVNIFEREAFEAEVEKAKTTRAKADTIVNRTKKTITEKMDEDPFFYRKFSRLLQDAIAAYHAERLNDAEYLAKVTEIMRQVRDGKSGEAPDILTNRDLSRALFGALQQELDAQTAENDQTGDVIGEDEGEYRTSSRTPPPPTRSQILAEAACSMEDIIRGHAVVRWRENIDAQNRMRNDLDDFLFELQRAKSITLSFEQMDAVIESVIRIAINRPDDV